MTNKDMAKNIRNDPGLQEALDEIVIDCYSRFASKLNNQGTEAQLKWLKAIGENPKAIYDLLTSE